jgi:hypothetical protein
MGVLYCWKIGRRIANPTIATWIIFEIGAWMSSVTYFSSSDHSAIASITNVTDDAAITAILIALAFKHWGEKIPFSQNHRLCLGIAVAAFILWVFTRMSWVGVLGFQMVMSVAYIPTFENLWRYEPGLGPTPAPAPEPAEVWGVNILSAALGVAIAIAKHDYVAMLYPLRACILCVVVLLLILRWRRKSALHCATVKA